MGTKLYKDAFIGTWFVIDGSQIRANIYASVPQIFSFQCVVPQRLVVRIDDKVFLENDFIVISQRFHAERAMYIAKANKIDAVVFNAQEVSVTVSPRICLRERIVRVSERKVSLVRE